MTNVVMLQEGGDNTDLEGKYFPQVDPGVRPFGSRVLVQIRAAKSVSKGGIIFTDNTKDTERDNTQVAKVLAIGPLAYKNRNSMESWAEGQWCGVGEYVFVPKYGGVRFERKLPPGVEGFDEFVQFAIIDDLNVIGAVDDPFNLKSFI
jgi:co-chaperonin GroES (HSP10)